MTAMPFEVIAFCPLPSGERVYPFVRVRDAVHVGVTRSRKIPYIYFFML